MTTTVTAPAPASAPAHPAPAARRGGGGSRRLRSVLLGGAGLLVLAALLEILPRTRVINPDFLPPLSRIAVVFGEQLATADFWWALLSTLRGWLLGLLIAVVAGVVLGVLIGSVPLLQRLLGPTIDFLRPIPSIVWVPLAVLLFGTTMQATLVMVVYASLWPILMQVTYGVEAVDRTALDTARSFRINPLRTAWRVTWPSIQPYLFVGIRLSATIALLLEITGELIIGSPGIGKLITLAQTGGNLTTMYALVWVSAILGILVGIGARALESRAMFWHASIRGEVAS